MLTPEYLEELPKNMIELYAQAEEDILMDMARRIRQYDYWIPAAEHQRKKLFEMGMVQHEIIDRMKENTGRSEQELKQLMKNAGIKTLEDDSQVYQSAGLNPPPLMASPTLKKVLDAGYRMTNKTFANLTKTTANTATKQFEDALDRAWMQIQTGGFDYNTAIRSAIKDLSEKGIGAIRYPSGHTDTIEVAVRRAVVTGVNKSCAELQIERMEELKWDLVEVSAHAGARPEHAKWQGKVYSYSGEHPQYASLKEATGYGTGAGLCGWNCRHSFRPYREGSPLTYSDALLKSYEEKKYQYKGRNLTEYEASQVQRKIERNIRRWKREEKAMAAAGLDTSEARSKVAKWRKIQAEFLQETGLKLQHNRTYIGNVVAKRLTNGIIKRDIQIGRSLGAAAFRDTVLLPEGSRGKISEGSRITKVVVFAGKGTQKPVKVAEYLEKQYGVEASEWKKVRGDGYVEYPDGSIKHVELHWFESEKTGRVKMKVKRVFDDES